MLNTSSYPPTIGKFYNLPRFPKPHIHSAHGGWAVRNSRGSIFYFDNLDYMRERWGFVSPYHEGNASVDLSDRIHPDLPEARAS